MLQGMKPRRDVDFRGMCFVVALVLLSAAARGFAEEPTVGAVATFNAYAGAVETRLGQQHAAAAGFLGGVTVDPEKTMRLRHGELIVEQLTPAAGLDLAGALLHHWRGTAFAPGAHAADVERVLREFSAYPRVYAPQVLEARVLAQQSDRYQVLMRVRQRHVITVVMDTAYDVAFGRLDAQHGFSSSRSTSIAEIDGNGRAISATADHGYLWRQNTWWSYEERDGGVYLQIESVSLTRSIPTGLGWAVGPLVESVPRDSLEFTLRSTCNALKPRT
jgi:hypothetical protein